MADTPKIFPQSEYDDVYDEFDLYDDIALSDSESGAPLPYGFTWAYNFEKGDLDFAGGDPVLVMDSDVIKEWILHTVNTERFETEIFGEAIGTSINSLYGGVIDAYVLARIKQETEKAVRAHDRVMSVDFITTFSSKNNVYSYLSYVTDDSVTSDTLLRLR